jgi:hypothetical protein
VGFGDVGRDVQAFELFALGRADAAGPEQQQVGLEAEQPLHVQLTVAATEGTPDGGGRSPASSTPTSRSAESSSTTISDSDGARLTTRRLAAPGRAGQQQNRQPQAGASAELTRDAVEVEQHGVDSASSISGTASRPTNTASAPIHAGNGDKQCRTPLGRQTDPGGRLFRGIEGFLRGDQRVCSTENFRLTNIEATPAMNNGMASTGKMPSLWPNSR